MKLVLSSIAKQYGGKNILNDCTHVFSDRGVSVLMGANGCGKSTLLRIMALLEEPDGGTVGFYDGDGLLAPDLALKRRITLLLPRIGLFNTSVFMNAAYGLNIRSVSKWEMQRRALRMLSFVGLEMKKDQSALTLSSGETQRLGIARALALDPEFLFLDEPTASTDEQNTRIIESIISTMKKEGRTGVIMTTHDRAQADRLADHLLLLSKGRLEQVR